MAQHNCGCSSVAELQLPKLAMWVRFPSPAPKQRTGFIRFFCFGMKWRNRTQALRKRASGTFLARRVGSQLVENEQTTRLPKYRICQFPSPAPKKHRTGLPGAMLFYTVIVGNRTRALRKRASGTFLARRVGSQLVENEQTTRLSKYRICQFPSPAPKKHRTGLPGAMLFLYCNCRESNVSVKKTCQWHVFSEAGR